MAFAVPLYHSPDFARMNGGRTKMPPESLSKSHGCPLPMYWLSSKG